MANDKPNKKPLKHIEFDAHQIDQSLSLFQNDQSRVYVVVVIDQFTRMIMGGVVNKATAIDRK